MFSLRLAVLSAFSLLALFGCTPSSSGDFHAEKDKIQSLSNQWTAAIVAGNIEKILNLYSPDAVQLQSGSEAITGHDAIRKWYQSWVTDPALSYTAKTVSIDVAFSCDLAYERGIYSFSQTTPKGVVKEIGKYVTIWKKFGGEWKAVLDTGTPDAQATI